jgi:hypothetical protein
VVKRNCYLPTRSTRADGPAPGSCMSVGDRLEPIARVSIEQQRSGGRAELPNSTAVCDRPPGLSLTGVRGVRVAYWMYTGKLNCCEPTCMVTAVVGPNCGVTKKSGRFCGI